MGFDTSNYYSVGERVAMFLAKYPDGRIQQLNPPQLVEAGGSCFLLHTAAVYRTADDPTPVHGTAWEPVPGPTNFTKESEAQNAETAAVGRALAHMGFPTLRDQTTAADIINQNEAERRSELRRELQVKAHAWATASDLKFADDKEKFFEFFAALGETMPGPATSLEEIERLAQVARAAAANA